MVKYQCNNCFKKFVRKSDYCRHLSRKRPCILGSKIDEKIKVYKCPNCDKQYNKSFYLNKHVCKTNKNTISDNSINNSYNHNTNIEGDIINNNNNITINKTYNLCPFAKDGTDCLTIPEKIAIFTSDQNPYEMIIIQVNLNPLKLEHHNVGIPDLHRSYGMIFNGEEWLTEKTSVILEILLNSKKKDLLKIHSEIKGWLSDSTNKTFTTTMNDMDDTLRPVNPIQIKSKNTLTTHLKKYFYNNRNLAIEAQKYTKNMNIAQSDNNQYDLGLKDGLTIEEVERQYESKKYQMKVIKEICKDLLFKSTTNGTIDKHNFYLIRSKIITVDNIIDICVLNCISNNLFRSAYLGCIMTNKILNIKIMQIREMMSFNFY